MSAKPIGAVLAGVGQQQPESPEVDARRVFMVLHGFYGNLFSSKFATGVLEDGEDQGMASARRVWAHSLQEFDLDTVKTALRRCRAVHTEFPPSLPQFVALCEAAKPRQVYRPELPSQPALEMSAELRQQRRAEARAAATEAAHRKLEAEQPSGLEMLKQACARAIADGGGDEAAALLQMDRILAPRSKA